MSLWIASFDFVRNLDFWRHCWCCCSFCCCSCLCCCCCCCCCCCRCCSCCWRCCCFSLLIFTYLEYSTKCSCPLFIYQCLLDLRSKFSFTAHNAKGGQEKCKLSNFFYVAIKAYKRTLIAHWHCPVHFFSIIHWFKTTFFANTSHSFYFRSTCTSRRCRRTRCRTSTPSARSTASSSCSNSFHLTTTKSGKTNMLIDQSTLKKPWSWFYRVKSKFKKWQKRFVISYRWKLVIWQVHI